MTPRSIATFAAIGLIAVACTKVPYTNRPAPNAIPEKMMMNLGATSYASELEGKKIKKKGSDVETLLRVGQRISKVANKPDFAWEFSLIQDESVNAWCLPGGYIGFYTGILPVLQSESGMAFVMGHEVGHAVARHGTERLTSQLTLVGGLAGLYLFLDQGTKLKTEEKAIVTGAIGLGAELGIMLPFSRKHESEADIIGTMYMAEAGYPPAEAVDVWDRMSAAGGSSVPAFLSTHPSNERRKKVIREWLPQAKKKYERNKRPGDLTKTLW